MVDSLRWRGGIPGWPLPADAGLSLTAYTAEPGSLSADRLALLASWAATPLSDTQDATTGGRSNREREPAGRYDLSELSWTEDRLCSMDARRSDRTRPAADNREPALPVIV